MENEPVFMDRNESNYGPAPKCYEFLKNADITKLSWYTRSYKKGVKSILSQRLAEEYMISEDRVILGYGAEDILKQIVQCYLKEGEKLMVPAYSWWYYKEIADEVGGTNCEYMLEEKDDTYAYNVESMIEMFNTEKPQMIFLCSPNNPTGNSISFEDLEIFLKAVGNTKVVLDEAYANFGPDNKSKYLIDTYPNLFIVRTFSKYYALAGLRIGYALLGKDITKFIRFSNRYLGFNRLNVEIAIAALDSEDYYIDLKRKYESDKKMIYNELGSIPGFKIFKSDANFVLVKIPSAIKDGLKKYTDSKGIIVKYMNEELLNSHIRISLGTQSQNKELVKIIKEYMTVLV